jgi:hypothetical protein
MGLLGIVVGYFYAPAVVLVRDDQIGFRYLLGGGNK